MLVVAAGILVAGCAPAGDQRAEPLDARTPVTSATAPGQAHAADAISFDDLSVFVATVPHVVFAEVTATKAGPKTGEEPAQLQLREVELRVDEDLRQSGIASTVLMYETGWGSGGQTLDYSAGNSRVGDRGLYFLVEAVGMPSGYMLVNSQSRYRVQEDGDRLEPSNPENEFSRELAARGRAQLRRDIMNEADRASRGETQGKPLPWKR